MKLELLPYELELKHTFRISREAHDFQPSLIVRLGQDGLFGLGETTGNPYYHTTVESISKQIEERRTDVEQYEFTTPKDFYSKLMDWFPQHAFVRCALDMAGHDLYGKLKNQPLYKLWGLSLDHTPLSNFTIGLDTIPKMIEKINEQPWPIYKIKLGTDNDIAIVEALREVSSSVFRIDANCAWTASETIENSSTLSDLGVEFIEQPLPAEQLAEMAEVKQHSALPLMADESCQKENDVAKCNGRFHGVNIKLTKCGGITPALRMINTATQLGLQKMVGCMTESSVGISAIAHLLPLLDYVDMDGAILLKKDIASGVTLDYGKAIFPHKPGSGAELL